MTTQKEVDEAERRIEKLCEEGIRKVREIKARRKKAEDALLKLWTLYEMIEANLITEEQMNQMVEKIMRVYNQ
tara:strand:- start:151 stop:369 length:219 start_codon:yes stop_codon:yes gene_type:complete